MLLLTAKARGAGASIILVRDGDLTTPPARNGILDGITGKALTRLFKRSTGGER